MTLTPVEQAQIIKLQAESDFYAARAEKEKLEVKIRNEEYDDEQASAEQHNIFAFYFPITTQSAGMCMQTLGYWARRQELGAREKRPFTIEICSPGGNVISGFALIDYIRELRGKGYEINTSGLGIVGSMAAVALQAGEKRSLGKNSYLMVHEVQGEFEGSLAEFEDQSKVMKRFNERSYALLAERSSLSVAKIRQGAKKLDWWLDADEALKAGFVDEIV